MSFIIGIGIDVSALFLFFFHVAKGVIRPGPLRPFAGVHFADPSCLIIEIFCFVAVILRFCKELAIEAVGIGGLRPGYAGLRDGVSLGIISKAFRAASWVDGRCEISRLIVLVFRYRPAGVLYLYFIASSVIQIFGHSALRIGFRQGISFGIVSVPGYASFFIGLGAHLI